MSKVHDGFVKHKHSFLEAYELLQRIEKSYSLQLEKNLLLSLPIQKMEERLFAFIEITWNLQELMNFVRTLLQMQSNKVWNVC